MRAIFGGAASLARGAQYATTDDGIHIAFTTAGAGEPLFWLPHYLVSHVELEWEFPQGYTYRSLSRRLQVIRFDSRGLGLSERNADDISLEARMRDIDAVARKLGLERFALAGIQGGGNLAASYAARYPARVTKIVFQNWAPNFRTDSDPARMEALRVMIERDWDMFTENIGGVSFGYRSQLAPGYGRLVRATLTQEMALRYGEELIQEDCYPLLPSIQCEALVLHSERSAYASSAAARAASATIPNSRLRVFEGDLPEHIDQAIAAIADFVAPLSATPETAAPAPPLLQESPRQPQHPVLTSRELEVLLLLVRGLSNRDIAGLLFLSPRTVERHLENLYRKTGTRNRAEAAAFAVVKGLATGAEAPS
jgi:DNA-binding CsgD family transcriptional regulator/pimeloyl-ACP methyl ester carboxylesterase